jgi:hypothetical protein
LGLVIVGAAALAIAAFLPLVQPLGAFRMVEDNTLIQHGGWTFIAIALGIAGSGYRASQGTRSSWWVLILLCVFAAATVVFKANDESLRTLYPVGLNGTVDTSRPGTVADLGIAIYVAGAGVAAAFIGSLWLRPTEQSRTPEKQSTGQPRVQAQTKKCPDCAETILADAKVCKHCGYRFALGKVKCNHCQHVQAVLLSQQRFVCEQCNAKLQRRATPAKGS